MNKIKYLNIIFAFVLMTEQLSAATPTGSILQVDGIGNTQTVTAVISCARVSKTGTGVLLLDNNAHSFGNGVETELAEGTITWTSPNHITTAAGVSYIGRSRSFTWLAGANNPVLRLGGDIGISGTTDLGTLAATSLATVNGAFVWSPSAFTGAGGLTVGTGATIDLLTGTVALPAGAGNYNLTGTLVLSDSAAVGATGTITVNSGGTVNAYSCTTQRATATPTGVITVAAGGRIIFPSTTGAWAKEIG